MIVDNWSSIGPVVAGVAASILTYKTIVMGVNAVTKTWRVVTAAVTVAQTALNAIMAANPIALVTLAIGALVFAGIKLYQNWDVVKETALDLWSSLKSWFGDLKDKVVGWFSNIINWG